jgi:hypothetical protein
MKIVMWILFGMLGGTLYAANLQNLECDGVYIAGYDSCAQWGKAQGAKRKKIFTDKWVEKFVKRLNSKRVCDSNIEGKNWEEGDNGLKIEVLGSCEDLMVAVIDGLAALRKQKKTKIVDYFPAAVMIVEREVSQTKYTHSYRDITGVRLANESYSTTTRISGFGAIYLDQFIDGAISWRQFVKHIKVFEETF